MKNSEFKVHILLLKPGVYTVEGTQGHIYLARDRDCDENDEVVKWRIVNPSSERPHGSKKIDLPKFIVGEF